MVIDMGALLENPSMKDKVSPEEWTRRTDLAACFRLIDHFQLNSSPGNHITARVPGEPDHFLINPGGRMFSEITASCLVKIDFDGNILQDEADAPTGIVNPAGHIIHSAIYMARKDANCVFHLHTVPGIAVSTRKGGFQYYCQESLRLYKRIGYHPYEGIARDMTERDRMAAELGDENFALVLNNHGSLVVGRTVGEAFTLTLSFEKACAIQIAAESGGHDTMLPSEETCEATHRLTTAKNFPGSDAAFPSYRRIVDAYYPSYLT